MPTGKVRFFDEEKGFGFISGEGGQQVYVHASVLGDDDELYPGARVEYSVVDGRRGPQALSVKLLTAPRPVRRNRKRPDDLTVIVEDLMKLLDAAGEKLKVGQYPDRKQSRMLATLLRSVAEEFDA
ncbi:cold-shock protein [Canibacter zhoujuaniae]|uniref:cold-shock protein n=1 Tax=Canibacter zhoujuaniae TaxID=2708343 RepID=UPI00141DC24F|nr:cold shock domain-containing protein [Canibacter zhoujuaniae]